MSERISPSRRWKNKNRGKLNVSTMQLAIKGVCPTGREDGKISGPKYDNIEGLFPFPNWL